jgi:4'-phosphopantetheinyl transferase
MPVILLASTPGIEPINNETYNSSDLMQSNTFFSSHILQLWVSRVSNSTIIVEQTIQNLFSVSEKKRLNLIKNNNKRREYLLSRALMRHALSQYFHRQEKEWLFIERPESAPVISNLPENIYLSLSHSSGFICFAISSYPIGIDIEAANKQRDYSALAEIFMNEEELDCLVQNKLTKADHFYRIWCAKEAYYKALSSSDQSATSLKKICFSALIEGVDNWHLIEGKIEQYRFAAMVEGKPEKINCSYFLSTDKYLDCTNCFEIH